MDTLEDDGCYITLIPHIMHSRVIHMDNITMLFEQRYILLMPFHACMHQIYLISIIYLTSLMLYKWTLENHQQLHQIDIYCHLLFGIMQHSNYLMYIFFCQ